MTYTESRIAIELEELALGDDAQALEGAEPRISKGKTREHSRYGFDSNERTLVGLGPVERARRSRAGGDVPDSQRGPQSEAPGPFIADDEVPPQLPGRRVPVWAVAAPVLLAVGVIAVAALRGLGSGPPAASPASQAPLTVVAAPEPDVPAPPAPPVDPVQTATAPERSVTVETAPRNAAAAPSTLPVKLPELTTPAVVDLSSHADAKVGALNLSSNPPANVVLDGRPLGKSPRVVKVPAGPHTVVFIHPLYGRQSVNVKVGPGGTANASADF